MRRIRSSRFRSDRKRKARLILQVPAGARELPPAKLTTEVAGPSIADGDRLFASGRYEDAGRCYAALAAQNRLPAHRQAHWAYCRMVDVARRINARPKTAGEWDEIEAEIVKIQRITPNNWYGEYLHNKVAEVRRGGLRTQNKSDGVVARGRPADASQNNSDPEPRRLSRLFGKSRAATPAPAQAADMSVANNPELPLNLPQSSPNPGLAVRTGGGRADLDSTGTEGADRSSPRSDPAFQLAVAQDVPDNTTPWQVLETPNFRIFHRNALAWPNRRGRLPKRFARRRQSAGKVLPCNGRGHPRASFTSTPLAKSLPSTPNNQNPHPGFRP